MTRRGTTVSTHVTKYTCLMDKLVRLSHQAAFHFFSLLFSNEELDQGEREVHGGAGPARGDDLPSITTLVSSFCSPSSCAAVCEPGKLVARWPCNWPSSASTRGAAQIAAVY